MVDRSTSTKRLLLGREVKSKNSLGDRVASYKRFSRIEMTTEHEAENKENKAQLTENRARGTEKAQNTSHTARNTEKAQNTSHTARNTKNDSTEHETRVTNRGLLGEDQGNSAKSVERRPGG